MTSLPGGNLFPPLIADASGLHRKTVALATSSGSMPRGNGERAAAYSIDSLKSGLIPRAARDA